MLNPMMKEFLDWAQEQVLTVEGAGKFNPELAAVKRLMGYYDKEAVLHIIFSKTPKHGVYAVIPVADGLTDEWAEEIIEDVWKWWDVDSAAWQWAEDRLG